MKHYVCACCREALPAAAYERWGTIGGLLQRICGAKGTCDDCRDYLTEFPAFRPVPVTTVEHPARPQRMVGEVAGLGNAGDAGVHRDLLDSEVVLVLANGTLRVATRADVPPNGVPNDASNDVSNDVSNGGPPLAH